MMLLPPGGIQRTPLREHFRPWDFLGRRALDITNVYKRNQAVQMPLLALERNVAADHPVVDDFGRNDFTATPLSKV